MDDGSRRPTCRLAEVLLRQLESTFVMIAEVIWTCSPEQWRRRGPNPPLWQQTYHVLFWTSAWLRPFDHPMRAPAFHQDCYRDMIDSPLPALTQEQLSEYLHDVSDQSTGFATSLDDETLLTEMKVGGRRWTPADIIVSQIRHLQHHAGSMNSVLRAGGGRPARWHGYNEQGIGLQWYRECILKGA